MAEKQTNKDRMREIVDSIENGIKELFESDKYRQYLSTMSRFHRYSVNNTIHDCLLAVNIHLRYGMLDRQRFSLIINRIPPQTDSLAAP